MKRTPHSPQTARRGGFTLIEMLAVMLILGILVGALLVTLSGSADTAKSRITQGKLAQISAVVDAYERRFGDFPPSSFGAEQGGLPNKVNVGVEALVVALWSNGYEGGGDLSADELLNTDGDQTLRELSDLPNRQLFELVDSWENPIVYFRSDDYGESHQYLLWSEEDEFEAEVEVTALRNENLGRFYGHARYQLISAGPDGAFGTDDDITSFDR
jgi:prepilin-type N-terminal cleavage/methylation domain-containing protein